MRPRYGRGVRAIISAAAIILGFTGGASAQTAQNGDLVLFAKNATTVTGAWKLVPDATAAGGIRVGTSDAGTPKLTTAAASPASYFELTFTPEAGRAYRLWVRGRAENDGWQNDSAFVQFSGSVDGSGAPVHRIGTTSAAVVSIEEGSGAGLAGWGWEDNGYGYGALGATFSFDGTPQRIRVQVREDGLAIDQILLSPVQFISVAPGAHKNDTTIFTVAQPAAALPEIVLHAKNATMVAGAWTLVPDATAAAGIRMWNPDAGAAKVPAPLAAPGSYFELTFLPEAKRAYRLWIRGKAENNTWQNDSTFVQFSGSTDAAGAPVFRIGSTSATVVSIEESSGAGVAGWGWQDNGYGVNAFGPAIYFDGTQQTLRVQVREDGLSIDQIVLSQVTYASQAPGLAKNDTTILAPSSTGGTTTTTTPPPPPPPPPPAPEPAPTGGLPLKVLQWNTHHGGYGTDNVYDTDRLATWIVRMNPDVVMLNEIERYTGWGNQNQPEVYKALLQQKTGKTWYYTFAQEWGEWTSNGKGNLILSTAPFEYTYNYELVHNCDRSVAEAIITWNGKRITLLLTHLDPDSQPLRLLQAQEVTAMAAGEPENRILTGDMNAWPDQTSIAHFNTLYNDSWTVAKALGTAIAFEGNDGQTKKGRIDYIYYSKGASDLSVLSSQVFDTRDANGVMPSDHRPLLTTFLVR